jgi:hypothetical protein
MIVRYLTPLHLQPLYRARSAGAFPESERPGGVNDSGLHRREQEASQLCNAKGESSWL